MSLLEVKDLEVKYGMIRALHSVSFYVDDGEIVTLIGANGAGKTTAMHAINGLIPKSRGTVTLSDRDVTSVSAHKLLSFGMAQVPEGRRVFSELTVLENLKLGYYLGRDKKEFARKIDEMYSYFPILKERAHQISSTLSGGEQQMLAMSRALMSSPRLLLLDEPSMGLSPLYVNTIFEMIRSVNSRGTTVLLVEQNAKKALTIANRAYVLENGKIVKSGSGKELLEDEGVRRSYLGG